MFSFGFTWKKTEGKAEVKESDYDILRDLVAKKAGTITHIYYEYDKQNRLHAHGIADFPNKNVYKKALQWKGYHTNYELIYNRDVWIKYITKDQHLKLKCLFDIYCTTEPQETA